MSAGSTAFALSLDRHKKYACDAHSTQHEHHRIYTCVRGFVALSANTSIIRKRYIKNVTKPMASLCWKVSNECYRRMFPPICPTIVPNECFRRMFPATAFGECVRNIRRTNSPDNRSSTFRNLPPKPFVGHILLEIEVPQAGNIRLDHSSKTFIYKHS